MTVYVPLAVPARTVIVSTDEPELTIEVGTRLAVMPAGVDAVRATVPLYPLSAATVMVEVPEVPARRLSEEGEAETEKSGAATLTVTVVV